MQTFFFPRVRRLRFGVLVGIAGLAVAVAVGVALTGNLASGAAQTPQPELLDAAAPPPPEPVRPAVAEPVHLDTPKSLPTNIYTVRTDHGSRSVDARSNRLDGGPRVLISPSGATELKTGGMAASFGFDLDLEAAVVGDAGQVAFAEPLAAGTTIYDPGGRESSRLVVVSLHETSGNDVRTFRFAANIMPEAFTSDGSALFVIEHLPALDPTHYRVKLLDLTTGVLSVVPGPLKSPPADDMFGTGRRQIGSSDGSLLFTLYTRQPGHHDGSVHHAHVHGFVHALQLDERWALCVDLPPEFGQGATGSAAVALDPTNAFLYVVDAQADAIAVFKVSHIRNMNAVVSGNGSLRIPSPVAVLAIDLDAGAHISAYADANGLWIAEGTTIRHVDATAQLVLAEYSVSAPVESFATSNDQRLFALVQDRLVPLPAR